MRTKSPLLLTMLCVALGDAAPAIAQSISDDTTRPAENAERVAVPSAASDSVPEVVTAAEPASAPASASAPDTVPEAVTAVEPAPASASASDTVPEVVTAVEPAPASASASDTVPEVVTAVEPAPASASAPDTVPEAVTAVEPAPASAPASVTAPESAVATESVPVERSPESIARQSLPGSVGPSETDLIESLNDYDQILARSPNNIPAREGRLLAMSQLGLPSEALAEAKQYPQIGEAVLQHLHEDEAALVIRQTETAYYQPGEEIPAYD
jgi:hypothetical protein